MEPIRHEVGREDIGIARACAIGKPKKIIAISQPLKARAVLIASEARQSISPGPSRKASTSSQKRLCSARRRGVRIFDHPL
jgi:hypothetical protein